MREHLSMVASRKLRWSAIGMATVLCVALLLSLVMAASAQVADGTEIWHDDFESGQGSWAMQNGTWSTAAAPAGGDGSGLAFYDPAGTAVLWANRAIAAPPSGATRIKASCDFYTASVITATSRACLWVSGSATSGANNQMFRVGTYNAAHYVCQYYLGGVGNIDTGIAGSIGWHKLSIVFDKAQKMVTWKFDNAWGTYGNANYGTFPTFALMGMNVSNGGSANGANVYFDNVKVEYLGAAPGKAANPSPINGAANVPLDVTLSWGAVTNAGSYDVYLGTSPTTLTKVSSAQTGTTFAPTGLAVGTQYYWRVDSLDGEGNPTMGDVWTFTTPGNFTATCDHGLATGSGNYDPSATVNVSVEPSPGWVFIKWSTDAAGTDTVSTIRSFTYTMPSTIPPTGVTLYAICESRTAVADIIVESRSGGKNYANYSEGPNAFGDSSAKSLVSDVTAGLGSRYSSVSDTYYGIGRFAQYAPNVVAPGNYTVYVTWPSSTNGCHYVTHEVGYQGGQNFSIWNQNQNPGSVTYSTNGPSPVGALNNIWNKLGTFPFAAGTTGYVKQYSLVPEMQGTPAASVRVLADAVKFQYNPPKAINPTPADGAFKIAKANPVLSWDTGGSEYAYDVYFGTSPTTMTKVSSLQGTRSFTCGTLAEATTYYWRVDPVNNGTTTGDVWSFITEGPAGTNYLLVKPNSASYGTTTGAGYYLPSDVAHVTATPKANYNFVKWTSDEAGNTQVSTSAAYDYTMPAGDAALYAQFAPKPYNVTVVTSPTGAGTPTVDGGASHGYNTSVTVHAGIPSDGYCFVNWSTNADGTGVVSRLKDYTFNMPGNDLTLYANYAKALFVEGFEGLVSGTAKNHGSLDMNLAGGDNAAAAGLDNGNPWWGTAPPNAGVGVDPSYTGATAHKGSNAAWDGMSVGGRDYVNLSYRTNNGQKFSEKAVYVDWWFYDPKGATFDPSTGDYSDDCLSLVYAGAIPTDTDYPSDVDTHNFDDSQFAQKISLGMATDWADSTGTAYAGFDGTKYQARIKGGDAPGQTPYANNWYNLNVPRTVGWHHARIVVGDIDWGNYVNPVSFYIDDMSTPALTGTTPPEFNALEITTMWQPTGVTNASQGTMYDDITFGYPETAPAAPTAAAVGSVTASSITWNWTQTGTVDGFRLYNAAVAGAQKGGDLSGTTNTYAESGLAANTQCSRWVVSYTANVFESARTALAPTYTLAAVPVYGTTGNAAVSCNLGSTKTDAKVGDQAVFTAVNGFGTGAAKASKYQYVWNGTAGEPSWTGASEWTTGDLTFTPAVGTYYLHLRAVNGAGVVNTTSATFGPYTFAIAGTPVAKISDLWPLANGQSYILSGKSVSGVVGGAFWIEETNRTAAIKVVWSGTAPAQDHGVDVVGTLSVVGGQRILTASSVTDKGALAPADVIKPVVVVERAAGGKGINADTPSISNGSGLYNIGMLVRIAGNLTQSGSAFYLDDGSGLTDGTGTGIKVICGTVTPTAGTKIVTGLVGIENGNPVLIIRGAGDIQ